MSTVKIIIADEFLSLIVSDLKRPHVFAHERVGFIYCDYKTENKTLTARKYVPISDGDYVKEKYVGACIGLRPIKSAIKAAFVESAAVFHVHAHEHFGVPFFSDVDEGFYEGLIPALRAVNARVPHGAFLLSDDSFRARLWEPDGQMRDYEFENVISQGSENDCD